MHDAGLCTFKRDSDNMHYIEIAIREDSLNEDVVSHELLHAFYIKKGFGRSSYNTINNIPFREISVLLNSIIEHKQIYEIQKSMGIDISQAQKHKANTIFKNIEKEPSIITYDIVVNSLLILECIIGAKEYTELYDERLKTNFKNTYELAKRLEMELFTEDIDNAEIFRKKFIRSLRVCDEYLSQHMIKSIPHFKLTENISIGYIPSEYQLLLRSEQIFNFKEVGNKLILMSKKDNQASYILKNTNNIETLKAMTVEELIGRIDGLVTIRSRKS